MHEIKVKLAAIKQTLQATYDRDVQLKTAVKKTILALLDGNATAAQVLKEINFKSGVLTLVTKNKSAANELVLNQPTLQKQLSAWAIKKLVIK